MIPFNPRVLYFRMSAWTSSAATFPNTVPFSFQKLISPEFNFGPTADFLYGKCLFTGAGGSSFVLAEELAVAARSKMNQDSMPPRYKPLQPYVVRVWQLLIQFGS